MKWHLSPSPVVCCDCGETVSRSSNRQKRCEPCQRAEHAARSRRDRAANPGKIAALNRRYRAANRERLLEADRQRYWENAEAFRRQSKERHHASRDERNAVRREKYWRGKVRPSPITPEQRAERKRQAARVRYHSDPLRWRMAAAIRRALEGRKERRSWTALVGYTVDELRQHIERQFLKGMTWENMGEWHLDHIVPLSAFKYESPDDPDFQAAWALTNLRPLWAPDNQKKHSKRLTLL